MIVKIQFVSAMLQVTVPKLRHSLMMRGAALDHHSLNKIVRSPSFRAMGRTRLEELRYDALEFAKVNGLYDRVVRKQLTGFI